jgi:hypothetical protein
VIKYLIRKHPLANLNGLGAETAGFQLEGTAVTILRVTTRNDHRVRYVSQTDGACALVFAGLSVQRAQALFFNVDRIRRVRMLFLESGQVGVLLNHSIIPASKAQLDSVMHNHSVVEWNPGATSAQQN